MSFSNNLHILINLKTQKLSVNNQIFIKKISNLKYIFSLKFPTQSLQSKTKVQNTWDGINLLYKLIIYFLFIDLPKRYCASPAFMTTYVKQLLISAKCAKTLSHCVNRVPNTILVRKQQGVTKYVMTCRIFVLYNKI